MRKANEIVAIPALRDMMAIEGAIVTIDAMGFTRSPSVLNAVFTDLSGLPLHSTK